MAFDLASAKPVSASSGGFDLSTAKPVVDAAPKKQYTDAQSGSWVKDSVFGIGGQFEYIPNTGGGAHYKDGPPGMTEGPDLLHQAVHAGSVFGRDLITGGLAIPTMIGDAAVGAVNVGRRLAGAEPYPSASEMLQSDLDYYGAHRPENNTERLYSAANRGIVSAATGAGLANTVAGATTGVTRGVAETLASNPFLQSVSGGTGSAAGELARQKGASPAGQFGAALLGSLAPSIAASGYATLAQPRTYQQRIEPTIGSNAERGAGSEAVSAQGLSAQRIEDMASEGAQKLGIDWGKVDNNLRAQITDNVKRALATNADLPPEAVVRDAIYRSQGLQTTKALVTRNFDDALNEQDLLTKPEGAPLRQIYDQNNQAIRSNIQSLAPEGVSAKPQPSFGQSVRSDLESGLKQSNKVRNDFYETARTQEGSNPADVSKLFDYMQANRSRLATSSVSDPVIPYLKDIGVWGKDQIKAFRSGEPVTLPRNLTLNEVTDIRKIVNAAAQTPDKNAASLLSGMRGILDDVEASAGGEAFKQARKVFGAQKSTWEGNPLLVNLMKDKRGFRGVDTIPDEDIFNKAVVNSTNDDFKAVWDRASGATKDLTRAQLSKHIEDKVFSNMGTNERGDVVASAAKLARVVDSVDEAKLVTIYGKKKADDLQLLVKSLREISSPPRGTVPQGSAPKLEMLTRSLLGAMKTGAKIPGVVGNMAAGLGNVLKSGVDSKNAAKAVQEAMTPIQEIQPVMMPRRLQLVSPGAAPIAAELERLQAQ